MAFPTLGVLDKDENEVTINTLPNAGQALAADSLPVVLTAAQITTLTPPAAITGFLTEADFDAKVGSLTETAPATGSPHSSP
jgi:hypothetical protein